MSRASSHKILLYSIGGCSTRENTAPDGHGREMACGRLLWLFFPSFLPLFRNEPTFCHVHASQRPIFSRILIHAFHGTFLSRDILFLFFLLFFYVRYIRRVFRFNLMQKSFENFPTGVLFYSLNDSRCVKTIHRRMNIKAPLSRRYVYVNTASGLLRDLRLRAGVDHMF